jgi:sugar O-acyltransferase (sialic acid O-acetyltransferase NeuD family)
MKNNLNIIGTGGHSRVVQDIVNLDYNYIIKLYDSDFKKCNNVIDNIDNIKQENTIIAIGNNKVRKHISLMLPNLFWISLIHPSAIIAKDVLIGKGTVVMAGVIIQSGTIIGNHCIINTGSCIDHDCIISDYVHIAPNSSIAGAVIIKEGVFVGIGASIINNIEVNSWSIIGAGSVVLNKINDNHIVAGNPAKFIKYNT